MRKSEIVLVVISLIISGAFISGCATRAKYVSPDSGRLIVTVEDVNIQDFQQAADAMIASLIKNFIDAGRLRSSVEGEPALLAISRIQNNTGQQIDTDLLVKKIRIALNRTGKVLTMTTYAYGGPEDPLAAEQAYISPTRRPRPDYTLSGKIIESTARAGRVRQAAYVFQLTLSDANGVAVWEEETTIVKQGTKPAIGF